MELACIAGAMEARGEISIPSWDDLSSAIADSVYEYYEGNSTGIKECSEIAIQPEPVFDQQSAGCQTGTLRLSTTILKMQRQLMGRSLTI